MSAHRRMHHPCIAVFCCALMLSAGAWPFAIAKSSSAPSRSVPTGFNERPSLQLHDPNAELRNGASLQPVTAIMATDASGKQETEQRDVDGVITTPPWD